MSHPRHELADLLSHSVRFSIVALLASASRADFRFVRDHVEVCDSVLSRQVTALEQAGLVRVHKAFVGKRAHTWLSLSPEGRRTFDRHLAALRRIIEAERAAGAAAAGWAWTPESLDPWVTNGVAAPHLPRGLALQAPDGPSAR